MAVLDGQAMREDIVSRLLGGEPDLSTSKYLDRISELASMEEAEHQFLIDPFDRSVALICVRSLLSRVSYRACMPVPFRDFPLSSVNIANIPRAIIQPISTGHSTRRPINTM